jgi:outer membrane immunogenic protein
MAADLPVPPPVAGPWDTPVRAPAALGYNWNGLYLGINGGGGWGRSRFDFAPPGATTGNFNTSGGVFGATFGLGWQYSVAVFGFEGDLDGANIKGTAICPAPIAGAVCRTKDNWLATARGRLGVNFNEWLVYGTAGVAFGDVNMTTSVVSSGQDVSTTGWAAGAGIEYAFLQNFSVKADYLHVDLGTSACSIPNCALASLATVRFSADVFRVGLNYRFGWGGPLVSRY